MPVLRSTLIAVLALAPAAALAQTVIVEPPLLPGEAFVPAEPMLVMPVAPLTAEDAAMIAMANGIVTVEDVDHRIWDGNFEVEGDDAYGDNLEILVDGQTGAVLEIDD